MMDLLTGQIKNSSHGQTCKFSIDQSNRLIEDFFSCEKKKNQILFHFSVTWSSNFHLTEVQNKTNGGCWLWEISGSSFVKESHHSCF